MSLDSSLQPNAFVPTTDTSLLAGEVEDDMQCGGLLVLQQRDTYCFSSDSALLANFAEVAPQDVVCDLCSGSGVVALLLAKKTHAATIVGVELQAELAWRSARSVARNGLAEVVRIWHGDAKECVPYLGAGAFDVVVCNPPYFKVGEGKQKEAPQVAMCRHEITIRLQEVLQVAQRLLRFGGHFYIVYTASRLAELLSAMRQMDIEPKRLVCVQPAPDKPVDTVLVEGKRGGKSGMVVTSALRSDLEARFRPPVER